VSFDTIDTVDSRTGLFYLSSRALEQEEKGIGLAGRFSSPYFNSRLIWWPRRGDTANKQEGRHNKQVTILEEHYL
jgi:hypothetical protein